MRIHLVLLLCLLVASLAIAQPAIRSTDGILNGASFQSGAPIAPGSLLSIFGSKLASQMAQASTYPLSTPLGGVTVQFVSGSTTLSAPLENVFPDVGGGLSQINAQVPWSLLPGGVGTATVNVIVNNNGVASAPSPVKVASIAPGIFAFGTRAIAANVTDATFAWPVGAVPGLITHPAKPGDFVTLYATGLGPVDTPVADGANSLDKLRNTTSMPVVMVGGVSAGIQFAGLSPQFAGVNVINVQVPNIPAGDNVPVQIIFGGLPSNSLTMAVGP
jgi:uncharacterized protein (TIGR03437 family)